LEPFANVAYVYLDTDGFSEGPAGVALSGDSESTDTTFSTLGLRVGNQFEAGDMELTVEAMLGWRHAFTDEPPTVNMAFAGSDTFTVTGVPIAEDAAVVEAGLDLAITPTADLGFGYSGQFGDGAE